MTNQERHEISRRLMIRAIPNGWYRTKRGTIVASIGPPVSREDPGDLASPRFHSADAEFFGPDALDDATVWLLDQAFYLYPESMAARDEDLVPWDAEIDRLACHAAETFGDDAVHEATARVRRATIPLKIPRTAMNVAACRRMTKEELGPRAASALDEAAHAVVMYRAVGVTGGVSIAPHVQILGHVSDHLSDSTAPVDLEARILCCYAGGCSQRRFAVRPNSQDCEVDDEIAEDLLRTLGAESREGEFRSRARTMVDQYWPQVVAVATQLWERGVLDGSEVQIICDQAAGDADADALDAYR